MGGEKKILGFQKTSLDSCKNFSRNFDPPSTLKSGIEKRCLSSSNHEIFTKIFK